MSHYLNFIQTHYNTPYYKKRYPRTENELPHACWCPDEDKPFMLNKKELRQELGIKIIYSYIKPKYQAQTNGRYFLANPILFYDYRDYSNKELSNSVFKDCGLIDHEKER